MIRIARLAAPVGGRIGPDNEIVPGLADLSIRNAKEFHHNS
jgi:hypothetical protein